MKKNKQNESVIKPSMRFGDEQHFLESKSSEEMPTLKSVGYTKIDGKWTAYTVTSKGDEVISIEVDQPDVRSVVEESAKAKFVNLFIDQE